MVWDGVSGSPTQIGVMSADDPSPEVTLTGPTFARGIQFDWSPDGTNILAVEWDSDQPWSLDPGGGPGDKTAWLAAIPGLRWSGSASLVDDCRPLRTAVSAATRGVHSRP